MKRTVLPTFAVLAVLSFAGYRYAEGQESAFEIARGKQIAPVTLNLNGKNPALVYLGSYLVNGVGGCNDCHTCPSYKGTNPFMVGGQALGLPAWLTVPVALVFVTVVLVFLRYWTWERISLFVAAFNLVFVPLALLAHPDWRAVLAAATLADMGLEDVLHLEGGFSEWKKAGRPVGERPRKHAT